MTEEEFRQLQEHVSVIHDMTQTLGWNLLQDAVVAKMAGRQNRIVQGRCENMEDYKAEVAFTDGMRYVLNLPATLQASLDQELLLRRETEEQEIEELVNFAIGEE